VRVLGVIPARGNSKRVKRKNLRLLCGKPLIQWTIEATSLASKLTDWVVSTEDYEIGQVASDLGAYVVPRPEELAQDDSTTGAVLVHALQWMEPDAFDMVVCLHPTSPIRDPKHIDAAIEKLEGSFLPTLASVCKLPNKSHPNIGTILDEDEWNGSSWPHYILNASIYCIKADWLRKTGKHVDTPCVPFEMDRRHSLDIDEEIDFKIAELFLQEPKRVEYSSRLIEALGPIITNGALKE
jgi:CMP-N,N'-diacetyllegionaminic acid synthase